MKKWLEYLPILIVLGYLLSTVLIFAFGPYPWPVPNPKIVYLFLVAILIAILYGFSSGLHTITRGSVLIPFNALILVGVACACVLFVPSVYVYTGQLPIHLIRDVTAQGQVYYNMQSWLETSNHGLRYLVSFLRMLAAPFEIAVIPLAVLHWRKLNIYVRAAFIVFLCLQIAFSICRGTDKEIADILILFFSSFLVLFGRKSYQKTLHFNLLRFIMLVLLVGSIIYVAFELFGLRKEQRVESIQALPPLLIYHPLKANDSNQPPYLNPIKIGSAAIAVVPEKKRINISSKNKELAQSNVAKPLHLPKSLKITPYVNAKLFLVTESHRYLLIPYCVHDICPSLNGFFFAHLNPTHQFVISMLDNYLSQGYEGLSIALASSKPFHSTYGLGHSMVLLSNYESITGDTAFYKRTYLYDLNASGLWTDKLNWSSIFPWLANDVSFPLVPIIFIFIAYMFALSWRDAVQKNNDMAVIVFFFAFYIFIYTPANNQLAQTLQDYFAFVVWLGLWIYFRFQTLPAKQ